MRITNQLTLSQSLSSYYTGQNAVNKYNQMINTGLVIQNSYEDASVSINNTRLDYEIATISQVKKATEAATELAKNSDATMQGIKKELEKFKVKLLQAANDVNDSTSLEAIANELEQIKKNIILMANTSINGQYLFSGTLVNNKPFDNEGNYLGNNENIFVTTGDSTKSPYNIPGFDLFFNSDSDYHKQISTNVSFKDDRYTDANPDKRKFLTEDSPFSYLVGQGYVTDNSLDVEKDFEYTGTKLDFPPSALFVQGVKPDGTSFKASLFVEAQGSVGDMLEQIGALYGNTENKQVVNVSMNDSGQIQIKDMKEGNKVLDFHATSLNVQSEDEASFKELLTAAEDEGITKEELSQRVLDAAFPNGIDIDNIPQGPFQVQVNGQNYDVSLNEKAFIKSKMTDTNGNASGGSDYDNVFFEKDGNKLVSNTLQVERKSGELANDNTKLIDVVASSNGTLIGEELSLNIVSKSGANYAVNIDLGNSSVSYTDAGGNLITFPITNEVYSDITNSSSSEVTQAANITYKQINDVIAMFSTDNMPQNTINVVNNRIDPLDANIINQGIKDASSLVEVKLDGGKLSLKDKFSNDTSIALALSSPNSGEFPALGTTNAAGGGFVFNANNALIIDEPNVDLISDLDKMIAAVKDGNMRADWESKDPRNTGMQGGIERLDHLLDHVNKQHTKIGAYQNSIEDTLARSTLLEVNVQELRTSVIGADYGESMMLLMNATVNLQAALMSSQKISQLSLLNYM